MRALRSTRTAPSVKTDLKPLSDALLPGLDDSYAPVRDAAAEALGTLQKALGERAMSAIIDNLDDIKKKKVLEYAAKAEVRFKVSAAVSNVKTSSSIQARPAGARAVGFCLFTALAGQHTNSCSR